MIAAVVATMLLVWSVRECVDVLRDVVRVDGWEADARVAACTLDLTVWEATALEYRETAQRWATLLRDVYRARDALVSLRTGDVARCTGERDCECTRCAWTVATPASSKPRRYPLSPDEGRALYVYDPQAFYRSIQSLRTAHA